ncbi:MAG: MFS transporter, partial [Candidatus Cybelea sp.]
MNPAWVLVAAILGSAMTFIDSTAVNVSLPVIQHELHTTTGQTQWVIEGYALFLSALILTGGALGDIYGRKLIFGVGIVIFALASLACAFANDITMLIVARCIQGIGGALSTPGSLSLISAAYDEQERGRAIGLWSGFSSLTSAAGPVIGGWLTESFSWRYVFVINVPLAVAVLLILALRVPESRDESSDRKVDVIGAALATVGLGLLVYGLIDLNGGRVSASAVGSTVAGLLALVAFVLFERRTP